VKRIKSQLRALPEIYITKKTVLGTVSLIQPAAFAQHPGGAAAGQILDLTFYDFREALG